MKKFKSLVMLSFVTLALVSCGKSNSSNNENKPVDPVNPVDPVDPNDDVEIEGDFIPEVKAYDEGMSLVWEGKYSNAIKVEYKKNADTTWTSVDKELIREKDSNHVRTDIIGLDSAYEYDVKITDSNNKVVNVSKVNVYAQDRSGYAHFKNTTGVGAYTNDGTLKNGAIVVYVNNDNKNTVTANIGGKTVTGLSKIIQSVGRNNVLDIRILDDIQTQQWNKITYGTGKTAGRITNLDNAFTSVDWAQASQNEAIKSGVDNSNSSSYRLCEEDIISLNINSMSNDIAKGITHLDGLTNNVIKTKEKQKTGYYEYDSYFNELDVRYCDNITIEGVGEDAGIFQWGFCFNQCNSIEVKNLHFKGYTEDAIGIQGGSNTNLDFHNYWIHNNTFDSGSNNWDVSYENDKNEGDGSTDFKYAHNVTMSYNRYNGCHKTALIGPGDTALQYNITFHHNFYNQCGSRLPFTRQSNIHAYNNYYYGSTGTNTQINNNAYFFVENSVFANANKTFTTSAGGAIKSYNNLFSGKSSSANSTVVEYRANTIVNSCMADGKTDMSKFDTDENLFYYDSEHQCSNVMYMHDVDKVAEELPKLAGSGLLNTLMLTKTSRYYGDGKTTDVVDDTNTTEAVKTNDVPTSAGIYYKVGTKVDATETSLDASAANSVTCYADGKIQIKDTSADYTTHCFYMFDNVYNSGTHKYSVELELTGIGSKWNILSFIDGASNFAVRSASDEKKYSYMIDGTTENVISTTKWSSSTKYNISLTVNYANNTAVLKIGDVSYTVNNYDITGIKGIMFMTAKTAADRSFIINSITVE